jgi:phage shock protein A
MNEMGQAEKLERRVARQETRAKSLKNKAEYLKDKKSPKTKATIKRIDKKMSSPKTTSTIKRIDKKMSRPMQTPAEKMSNTPKPNATMRTPRKK